MTRRVSSQQFRGLEVFVHVMGQFTPSPLFEVFLILRLKFEFVCCISPLSCGMTIDTVTTDNNVISLIHYSDSH